MEQKLKATVAEQDRREEVAAELKAKRDHDLNKHCAKAYRAGKQLSAAQEELTEANERLKASNLALFESQKLARGLAQKLISRDRILKSATDSAANTAANNAAA
eukprot:2784668-Pleurochrysis_carterae.AAC.1